MPNPTLHGQAMARWPEHRAIIATLTQDSSDGVCVVAADGAPLFLNPAAQRLLGWTAAELSGLSLHDAVHGGGAACPCWPAQGCPLLQAIGSGSGVSGETDEFRRKDGGALPVSYTVRPLLLDERMAGAIVTFRDITARRLDQALHMAERRVRALFHQSPWGIISYAPNGDLLDANQAALDTMRPEQTAGYNVLADERLAAAGLMDGIRRAFAGEATRLAPLYYTPTPAATRPAARGRWLRGFLYPVTDDAGAVSEVVAMAEDITEQYQAEQLLGEAEAQYRAIFEASSDGIIIATLEGAVVKVNPAACRIYGYSPEEFVRLHPMRFIHPEHHHRLEHGLQTVKEGGFLQAQSLHLRRDGTSFPVDVHATSFTYCGAPHALIIVRDITEQIESYQMLEQRVAERTRELSTLLEVSHTVASTLELQPLLGLILDHLKTVVDYSGAAIQGLEGDGLTVLDYRGPLPRERSVGLRVPFHPGGLEERVIRGGTPVIMDDVRGLDDAHRETNLARAYQDPTPGAPPPDHVRSWLGVPLLLKGRAVGMLTLVYREPGHYTPHHATLALAMAGQAAVAIENARLYQQAQHVAAQDERQRLARELHDAVTQTLFSASLIAEMLPRLWEQDPDAGRRRLEDVRLLTLGALAEMRMLLLELRPSALIDTKLADLLRQLAAALTGRKRLPVTLRLDGERAVPPDVQVALYRVAQEALNNIAKHARAAAVELRLRSHARGVALSISDDGRGFDASGIGADHFGLRIMRERADAIGARLSVRSRPGAGTCIRVVWRERGERGG